MIKIHTLGTARVDIHTGRECVRISPAAGKRFGLLLYLVAQPGYRAARTTLQELLLAPRREGRHGLRELLYQVKRCGAEIEADIHTAGIAPDSVQRDWTAITEGTALSRSLLRSAEGGFLPGYRPSHSAEFADWYAEFRTRTVGELCRAILAHVDRSLNANDLASAEAAARACLVLDPSNGQAKVALGHTVARRDSGDDPPFAGAVH